MVQHHDHEDVFLEHLAYLFFSFNIEDVSGLRIVCILALLVCFSQWCDITSRKTSPFKNNDSFAFYFSSALV